MCPKNPEILHFRPSKTTTVTHKQRKLLITNVVVKIQTDEDILQTANLDSLILSDSSSS